MHKKIICTVIYYKCQLKLTVFHKFIMYENWNWSYTKYTYNMAVCHYLQLISDENDPSIIIYYGIDVSIT